MLSSTKSDNQSFPHPPHSNSFWSLPSVRHPANVRALWDLGFLCSFAPGLALVSLGVAALLPGSLRRLSPGWLPRSDLAHPPGASWGNSLWEMDFANSACPKTSLFCLHRFFFFFFTGFVECNVTGGKLFSFRIVRTLFHGQVSTSLKLFGSLESLCMISFLSSPPPPEVCGIFFYPWESYQAPSPQQWEAPVPFGTFSWVVSLPLCTGAPVPTIGESRVESASFSYLRAVVVTPSGSGHFCHSSVRCLQQTWVILCGRFWQDVVLLAKYWLGHCSNYIHPV